MLLVECRSPFTCPMADSYLCQLIWRQETFTTARYLAIENNSWFIQIQNTKIRLRFTFQLSNSYIQLVQSVFACKDSLTSKVVEGSHLVSLVHVIRKRYHVIASYDPHNRFTHASKNNRFTHASKNNCLRAFMSAPFHIFASQFVSKVFTGDIQH